MFSSPMKTRLTPARAHFSMKFGSLWQSVSTWMMKLMLSFSTSRSWMSRSRIGSQSLLRAKLSSVMKKRAGPARNSRARCCSTSSGERRRDLRPCTLMMVQNEHWNGQPRPASKLVVPPAVRCARSTAQQRDRRALDARQIVHEIVERLERARGGVAQHLSSRPSASPANSERPIAFARSRSASTPSSMRQHAGDVEAADADLDAARAQRPRDDRARAETGSTARRPASPCRRRPPRSSPPGARGGCGCWSRRRRGSRSRRRRRARGARRSPWRGRRARRANSTGSASASTG